MCNSIFIIPTPKSSASLRFVLELFFFLLNHEMNLFQRFESACSSEKEYGFAVRFLL